MQDPDYEATLSKMDLAIMPLTRIAEMLELEVVPVKLTLVLDSVEKMKFYISSKKSKNWKLDLELDTNRLRRVCDKLCSYGVDLQLVFVSALHLDLGVPLFQLNFITEKPLYQEVLSSIVETFDRMES